jgi:hypothetical protein
MKQVFFISVLTLLMTISLNVFALDEPIWRDVEFGMSVEEVSNLMEVKLDAVELDVNDIFRRYKCSTAIGDLDNVLVMFDFYEDELFRIFFFNPIHKYRAASLYNVLQERLSNRWGDPDFTEINTPEPYEEYHWSSDAYSILKQGGYLISSWDIDETNGLVLRLPGVPVGEEYSIYVIIKWTYVNREIENTVASLLEEAASDETQESDDTQSSENDSESDSDSEAEETNREF